MLLSVFVSHLFVLKGGGHKGSSTVTRTSAAVARSAMMGPLRLLLLSLAAVVAFQLSADIYAQKPREKRISRILRALSLTSDAASAVGPATGIPSYSVDVLSAGWGLRAEA